MKVRLLSVPHTGTRFVIHMLKRNNVAYRHTHFWGRGRAEPADELIYDHDTPAIIPLRDKDKVRESWARRHTKNYPLGLDACWEEMENYRAANPDICYVLRIDDPKHRLADLARIEAVTGTYMTVDFDNKIAEGKP